MKPKGEKVRDERNRRSKGRRNNVETKERERETEWNKRREE